MIDKSDVEMK